MANNKSICLVLLTVLVTFRGFEPLSADAVEENKINDEMLQRIRSSVYDVDSLEQSGSYNAAWFRASQWVQWAEAEFNAEHWLAREARAKFDYLDAVMAANQDMKRGYQSVNELLETAAADHKSGNCNRSAERSIEAARLLRSLLGRPSIKEALILSIGAKSYESCGDERNALSTYERMRTINFDLLGESHPDSVLSLICIARNRWQSSDWEKGFDTCGIAYGRAQAIRTGLLQEEDRVESVYFAACRMMATVSTDLGFNDGALRCLKDAQILVERRLEGPADEKTNGILIGRLFPVLIDEASVLARSGRRRDAVIIGQKVLSKTQLVTGEHSSRVGKTSLATASIYAMCKELELAQESLKLSKECADPRERLSQTDSVGVQMVCSRIEKLKGNLTSAQLQMEAALNSSERHLGENHPSHVHILNDLIEIAHLTNNDELSRKYEGRKMQINKQASVARKQIEAFLIAP
jgi:hypothetical protein